MDTYIVWSADKLGQKLETAIVGNNAAEVGIINQRIQHGNSLMRGWIENAAGRIVLLNGIAGAAAVPDTFLAGLPTLQTQISALLEDTITFGVSLSISEANRALQVAQARGGNRILWYTPDLDRTQEQTNATDQLANLKTVEKSEGYHETDITEDTKDHHRALMSLKEELEAVDWYQQRIDATNDAKLKEILEHNRDEEKEHATKLIEWLRENGFEAEINKAEGEEQSPNSQFMEVPQESPAPEAAPDQPAAQPSDSDQIKNIVMNVLKQIKSQKKMLDQLKLQAPDTYKAILGAVQAMIVMARARVDSGGEEPAQQDVSATDQATAAQDEQQQAVDLQKETAIGLEEEMKEHQIGQAEALKLVQDHLKLDSQYYSNRKQGV